MERIENNEPPPPPPQRQPLPPASPAQITAQLKTARTMEELFKYINRHGKTLGEVHCSECWRRSGRLLDGFAHSDREQRWLAANPSAITPLLELTLLRLPAMGPHALATTAHAMAKSQVTRRGCQRQWELLASHAAASVSSGKFTPQQLSNTVWAFASVGHAAPTLFETVAKEAAPRLHQFNAQNLANTAWAYATAREVAPALFAAMAAEFEGRLGELDVQELGNELGVQKLGSELGVQKFGVQDFGNLAWAFAIAGEPTPACLDPAAVLEQMEAQQAGAKTAEGKLLPTLYYNMAMEGLVARGQLEAGFTLLERLAPPLLEATRDCFPLYRTLLEGCRDAGDAEGASQLQTEIDRLGLIALSPVATVRVRGNELCSLKYGHTGEGVAAARELWSRVRRRTDYTPQLQAVPLGLVQKSTPQKQERSLQVHAEKKALAVLLLCSSSGGDGGGRIKEATDPASERDAPLAPLEVSISCATCADCHAFFASASLLLGRPIRLSQPRMDHMFANGRCSCNGNWS